MMVNRDKDDNGVIGEGVESKRQNESTDIDMILNEADQQGRYDSSYRVADGIVILEEKWEVNSSEELHYQLLKRCDNTPNVGCFSCSVSWKFPRIELSVAIDQMETIFVSGHAPVKKAPEKKRIPQNQIKHFLLLLNIQFLNKQLCL